MFGIVTGETIAYNYFEVETTNRRDDDPFKDTCVSFSSQDATSLFVGSMILAQAMQYVQLHRRLALFVLNWVGSTMKWSVRIEQKFFSSLSPSIDRRSMAGLMGVTALVSMWMNNSAATSIMMPAAVAIIDETENYQKKMDLERQQTNEGELDLCLFNRRRSIRFRFERSIERAETRGVSGFWSLRFIFCLRFVLLSDSSNEKNPSRLDSRQLKAGFLVAVAYSSAIGGIVTLVGTPSNIFAKGFMEE